MRLDMFALLALCQLSLIAAPQESGAWSSPTRHRDPRVPPPPSSVGPAPRGTSSPSHILRQRLDRYRRGRDRIRRGGRPGTNRGPEGDINQRERPVHNRRSGRQGRDRPPRREGSHSHERRGRPPWKGKNWRKSINQQRMQGNKQDQCPCVKPPGYDQCIAYDSAFQACTYSEAVLNFPDLTQKKASTPKQRVQCERNDYDCKACAEMLIAHIKYRDPKLATQMQEDVATIFGNTTATSTVQRRDCKRKYGFLRRSRNHNRRNDRSSSSSEDSEEDITNDPEFKATCNKLKDWGRRYRDSKKNGRRVPRQANKDDTVGKRHIINCVGKGESENDESDDLCLCGMCWAWRQLPDDYFPSIINELICNSDQECLSGWGSCVQRYRNLNVLKKNSEGDWVQTTISSSSCCDCKVDSSAPIVSSLVM